MSAAPEVAVSQSCRRRVVNGGTRPPSATFQCAAASPLLRLAPHSTMSFAGASEPIANGALVLCCSPPCCSPALQSPPPLSATANTGLPTASPYMQQGCD